MAQRRTVQHSRVPPRRLRFLSPIADRARGPYRRLRRVVSPRGLAGSRGRLGGEAVALTFDDGPHPRYTHEVLDVLAAAGIPATFFVVGRNAREHPAVIRRILAEGHAVASHSMTHPDPWRLSPVALYRDYRAGHLEVSDVVGMDIRLFRPPKGHLDLRGALAIRLAGLNPYLWSVDAADWEPELRPEDIVERLGRPKRGAVILLHDAIEGPLAPAALDRSAMIAGLAMFLDRSRQEGVRFTTLAEAPTTGSRPR